MDIRDLGLSPINPVEVLSEIVEAYAGSDPDSVDAVKVKYLEDQCLSKFFDESTGDPSVLRRAAFDAMEEAEAQCARINRHGLALPPNILLRARHLFADTVGEFSYEIFSQSVFTNGSTVDLRRTRGDAFFKFACRRPTVTPRALPYAAAIVNATPLWLQAMGGRPSFTIVPGGKFETVRKNSKTDREIEPQPTMNVHLQRAIGLDFRSKLRRVGIDLRDQSRNRRLARRGSIDGSISTLDLRMASSTIAWRCVFELSPPDWFDVMDDLRTHGATIPKDLGGGYRAWERFSSMGNGFTFELETLIFYVIARATIEDALGRFDHSTFGIYGDDLIVPTAAADAVMANLVACGFLINVDKSFTTGFFRESCGGHYYKGVDVSPFYIRKPIDSVHRACWLLNRIRKWASTTNAMCDSRMWPIWLKLRRRCVPSDLLGGFDIDAIDCVFSNHNPRKRLVRVPSTVGCDGPFAVLRKWQRLNHTPVVIDNRREWQEWSEDTFQVLSGGDDPTGRSHSYHLPFERVYKVDNVYPVTVSRSRPASYLFYEELADLSSGQLWPPSNFQATPEESC